MATKKSTQSARKAPAKRPAKTRAVPVLSQPYSKAPAVDPYLRPESITTETITFGDVSLPPIQRGIQPGVGVRGEPVDFRVAVIWVNRRQIDWTLRAIEQQCPELETVLKIVSRYMCALDTVRSEAGLGIAAAKTWLNDENPNVQKALDQLDVVTDMLGNWHDEHRLLVR